ncbi:hypothetical protein JAAARDRAFT_31347 [Jaapia argillacea MUCL 33604]|uniref:Protein kinase domain-containing protein n=1 Tax=Jaapia argillacea MUCL 33604 TaxID=933084 RepID=A0A067Q477_9AGAM|nr:hypothetical protein JAAARDRAFT_31347 [Jaapia argillacea MUCL 33604]
MSTLVVTVTSNANLSLALPHRLPDLSTQLGPVDHHCQYQGPFYDVYRGGVAEGVTQVPVAIKTFRTQADEQTNDLIREQYLREVRVYEFLGPDYPFVTEVLGIATIEGRPAIVMRYYANGDVVRYSRLNLYSAVEFIISLVEGVKYLHTNSPQIVHGDLHPSNIVVSDDGRALISGLGSAHVPGSTEYTASEISASFRWAAPELVVVNEDDDTRPPTPTFESDMWALASTVAQIITGKVPYHLSYPHQVVLLIISGVPPYDKASFVDAAKAVGVTRSEDLWHVLEQCWAMDPTRRLTVVQFEAALRDVLGAS